MEPTQITSQIVRDHITAFSQVHSEQDLHCMTVPQKVNTFYDYLDRFNKIIAAAILPQDTDLPKELTVEHEYSFNHSTKFALAPGALAETVVAETETVKQMFKIELAKGQLLKVQDGQEIEISTMAEEGDANGIARNIKDKVYTVLIQKISTVFEVYTEALKPIATRLEAEEKEQEELRQKQEAERKAVADATEAARKAAEAARPKNPQYVQPTFKTVKTEAVYKDEVIPAKTVQQPVYEQVQIPATYRTVTRPAQYKTVTVDAVYENQKFVDGTKLTTAGKVGIVATAILSAVAFTAMSLVIYHLATGESIMIADYDITTISELFNEYGAAGFGVLGVASLVALWASWRFGRKEVSHMERVEVRPARQDKQLVRQAYNERVEDQPARTERRIARYEYKVVEAEKTYSREVTPATTKTVQDQPGYYTVEVNGQRVRYNPQQHGNVAGIPANVK